jgi:peptide/nickel transport system ATP-binding protein
MRLIEPDAGTVRIGDVDLTKIRGKTLREQRRRIQMVFQDPFASLNPRRKVGNIITDGPIAHGVDPAAARKRAGELLGLVGSTPARWNAFRMNSPAANGSASALRGRWRSTGNPGR